MQNKFNPYLVCLLDVLGFESRFKNSGLGNILEKYLNLIKIVDYSSYISQKFFGQIDFKEGAYWTKEREPFIINKINGVYASDSVLLFANANFSENRYPAALNTTKEQRENLSKEPGKGWMFHPIPCDRFLDACNEVICFSIEIGLPLRGALSSGEAVLNLEHGIFLGQPLIDAARMEHHQNCIGASFIDTFMFAVIPKRYQLPFNAHFKRKVPVNYSGFVLDWPRHWRNTRKNDPKEIIASLNTHPEFSLYYENTIDIIEASDAIKHLYEEPKDTAITKVYPQFSSDLLELGIATGMDK